MDYQVVVEVERREREANLFCSGNDFSTIRMSSVNPLLATSINLTLDILFASPTHLTLSGPWLLARV